MHVRFMLGAFFYPMKQTPNTQNFRSIFPALLVACLFFHAPASGARSTEKAADKKPDPQTVAEFEAMKDEWEKVRDQQVAMIQQKEEDLERLKEELFVMVRRENITETPDVTTLPSKEPAEVSSGAVSATAVTAASADPAVTESFRKKIAELKETNACSSENAELRSGTVSWMPFAVPGPRRRNVKNWKQNRLSLPCSRNRSKKANRNISKRNLAGFPAMRPMMFRMFRVSCRSKNRTWGVCRKSPLCGNNCLPVARPSRPRSVA